MRLYLASASPRRHEILTQLAISHEVVHVPAPDGEDEPILPGESPPIYAERTTLEKLTRARQWIGTQPLAQQWPILCADTCVAFDNEILGKPETITEAHDFLRRLSGQHHWVYTAQALWFKGQTYHSLSANKVLFRPLQEHEITAYCATGEPFGKAGGYGIQGQASYFIERLEGRYSAVMGLDIFDLYALLRQAGLQALALAS